MTRAITKLKFISTHIKQTPSLDVTTGLFGSTVEPVITEELKSASQGSGVRCADLDGTTTMPRWCADSWDTRQQVQVRGYPRA